MNLTIGRCTDPLLEAATRMDDVWAAELVLELNAAVELAAVAPTYILKLP